MIKKALLSFVFALTLLGVASVFVPVEVFAQADGLDAVNDAAGLGEQDIRITIARLIRVFLGVLGVVAVALVIYGGFTWMTAGGDPAKVDRAKRILINGVIGFIIIFASFSIASFVLSSLLRATGAGGGALGGDDFVPGGGLGGSGTTSFIVSDILPEGDVPIRNVEVQAVFSRTLDRTLDDDSIGDFVTITREDDGSIVDGTFNIGSNRVSFTPAALCPDLDDVFCFDSFTTYRVTIDDALLDSSGRSLDCRTGCTSIFTTGDIIDTEDPSVNFTYPEDRVQMFYDQEVQAVAVDDFGVSTGTFAIQGEEPFDSVPAPDPYADEVYLDAIWRTDGLEENVFYTLEVTARDLAGNTAVDILRVKAIPAHCFDGLLTEGEEEGIDCGLDCPSCDGIACVSDDECAGVCRDGFCASPPLITTIAPLFGSPGTYVTIQGMSFGRGLGTVQFTGEEGPIDVTPVACSEGWTNDQLIVEVPEGAIEGPITVLDSEGLSDTSSDGYGPIFADFAPIGGVGINICGISPDNGLSGSVVALEGDGFGDSQDDGLVTFGIENARTYPLWSNEAVNSTVPPLAQGDVNVFVSRDARASNPVRYTVRSSEAADPFITTVNPDNAAPGEYVTVMGERFGSLQGTVWFSGEGGELTLAEIDFPDACADDIWRDDEVVIIVPELDPGSYELYLNTQGGDISNRIAIDIEDRDPSPGICKIEPSESEIGASITLFGDNFGGATGSISFFPETFGEVESWTNREVVGVVPEGAATGPVSVVSAEGRASNTRNLEIVSEDGEVVVGEGQPAMYAWRFSTGEVPQVPQLIRACSDEVISAVPNDRFTPGGACANAVIRAGFTMVMDEATLNSDTIILERCVDESCNDIEAFTEGDVTLSSTPTQTFFTLYPNDGAARLRPNTHYRVRVTTGATALDGTPLAQDASWEFATRGDAADCSVESVRVAPTSQTLTEDGETTEFEAIPMFGACQVLRSDSFDWRWEADPSIATLEEACSDPDAEACILATAEGEGFTEVIAKPRDRGGSRRALPAEGSARLTVNYTDPYVSARWPDCSVACTNAAVGVRFNIPMNLDRGLPSIEDIGMMELFRCDSEFCTNLTPIAASIRCVEEVEAAGGRLGCLEAEFDLSDRSLDTLTYYRAIVSGRAVSTSGNPLTRLNYGTDYSWTFLTREDNAACSVARIELSPDDQLLENIGDRQVYSVTPYGEADSCSVAGQRLSGYDYEWEYENPIIDDAGIAEWGQISASLIDSDPSRISAGCTDRCTPTGSALFGAICGNGLIEYGEECDGGPNCSANCLNEGSLSCTFRCSETRAACSVSDDCSGGESDICEVAGGGCCGDGVVDAVEECDDGNIFNGDGCSASCLNEGADAAGLTCGDGIVSYTPSTGGEECDDGNRANGDGCSSICLLEGSPSLGGIGAICGNGVIEAPFESCDDGNDLNGDGCSNTCLREGSLGSIGICGNAIVDIDPVTGAGEDCDGGEGCSDYCLYNGSSLSYSSPSVCGDGVLGLGEYPSCEIGGAGDGRLDPEQVAIISTGAQSFVDPETNEARTTIRVEGEGLLAEASLGLSCTATSDDDCPLGYGVDEAGCCGPRPTAELYPNGANVCRNTAIYADFSERIDLATLEEQIAVVYTGPGCPAGHGARLAFGQQVRSMILGFIGTLLIDIAEAQDDSCNLPITSLTQKEVDGAFRVYIGRDILLEPLGTYEIVLGNDGDGIRTETGIRFEGEVRAGFTASNEICSLDGITIIDRSDAQEFFFTSINEIHGFSAEPYSIVTGVESAIEPIPGVYEWTWGEWLSDDEAIVTVTSDEGSADSEVQASNRNGRATVAVSANITDNRGAIPSERSVIGAEDVTVLLCEHPWPLEAPYSFIDSPEGEALGAEELPGGWMHFSTHYCRDLPGEENTLPAATVIVPPDAGTDNILKEYFFTFPESGDAIGIRVAQNPEFLSPAEWYSAQGFSGAPSTETIGLYEAVRDGRTLYLAAPNRTDAGPIYSNIYLISYNEGALPETLDIYNQLQQNLAFNVNVQNLRLCSSDSGLTDTVCATDLDCNGAVGETCGANRDELARDIDRLTDLRDMESSLAEYGRVNGLCSATTTQSCSNDGDCPGGESCLSSYPSLPAGTFVRSIDASPWNSWNEVLANALGDIPTDPINRYGICEDKNPETCVSEATGEYTCPEGSLTYHYRSTGPFSYDVSAELEYNEEGTYWVNDIDQNLADGLQIRAGRVGDIAAGSGFDTASAFCSGVSYGAASSCGDGIIGPDEVCEPGQRGESIACDITPDDGVEDDGLRATICRADCSGFDISEAAACVPTICGNGVIDEGEACDDGALNGRYGFCDASCSGLSFHCGDGMLAGGEVCDCGVDGDGLTSGGLDCVVGNGGYDNNPALTCSASCNGPGPYCGDGIVQYGEMCDGDIDTWSGELCVGGDREGFPCASNDECGDGGICGDADGGPAWAAACPVTNVCIGGDSELIGFACEPGFDERDCGLGGICSATPAETLRTRTCNDNGAGGQLCRWTQRDWSSIECVALSSCGNGVVDAGEECDDGNDNPNDSCTTSCRANVCGDGFVYDGVEICDSGASNGLMCEAPYGASCAYCSSECRLLFNSGAFCGDGVINGGEFCDSLSIAEDGASGICNGGPNASQACTVNGDCGDGFICEQPVCSGSCDATCPANFANAEIQMKDNQVGSVRSDRVELLSYDSEGAPDVPEDRLGAPDAATIYMPACRVISHLTADVSFNYEAVDSRIVFVTDLSGSMRLPAGDSGPSRMDVTKGALNSAIDRIFETIGDLAEVALVGYGNDTTVEDFRGAVEQYLLTSAISEYASVEGVGTNTYEGLGEAYRLLRDVEAPEGANKIAVLMTDGEWQGTLPGYNPAFWACQMKDAGMEIYTAKIGSGDIVLKNELGDVLSAEGIWSDGEECDVYKNRVTDEYYDSYEEYLDSLEVDREVGFIESSPIIAHAGVSIPTSIERPMRRFTFPKMTLAGMLAIESVLATDICHPERETVFVDDPTRGFIPRVIHGSTIELACLSSGNPSPETGIDYAHQAENEEEIEAMYDEIVNAIIGATAIIVDDPSSPSIGAIIEGNDVEFPLPDDFVCDPFSEQPLPLQLTFDAVDPLSATVEISDVTIHYCSP